MSSTSPVPVLASVKAFKEWRHKYWDRSIGLVPTMGALHEGHIKLVQRSLAHNDITVVSIFVNPAQFAPHEDLSTYPITFDSDMAILEKVSAPQMPQKSCVVFLPSAADMYPSGIVQDVKEQKGTFVEVKGYGHQMEGKSRPTFFRGVATVVTKLFNVVQPNRAYFGQKDIQQALLLRRLVRDLLMSFPSPENLVIVPTLRSSTDGLALSSRNVYLTDVERKFAGALFEALEAGRATWNNQVGRSRDEVVAAATTVIRTRTEEAERQGVQMTLDYIEMNDPDSFDVVDWLSTDRARPAILSGALKIGRTRLIDNLLCGDSSDIISS